MQAYVDMFSKSLNLELAPLGISVQNQAPAYVTTKMSKLRHASLDIPTPKRWVADAIKHIGFEATSSPYWCICFLGSGLARRLFCLSASTVKLKLLGSDQLPICRVHGIMWGLCSNLPAWLTDVYLYQHAWSIRQRYLKKLARAAKSA